MPWENLAPQCSNCMEYGHIAYTCTRPRRCRNCKKEGHEARECTKCPRCKKWGHDDEICYFNPKNIRGGRQEKTSEAVRDIRKRLRQAREEAEKETEDEVEQEEDQEEKTNENKHEENKKDNLSDSDSDKDETETLVGNLEIITDSEIVDELSEMEEEDKMEIEDEGRGKKRHGNDSPKRDSQRNTPKKQRSKTKDTYDSDAENTDASTE